jgi:hypothetical protein
MAWSVRSGSGVQSVVHPAIQNSEVEDDAYSATLFTNSSPHSAPSFYGKYTYCD